MFVRGKYACKATVKDSCFDEYIKRHNGVWHEMVGFLKNAGIKNYTIWNVGDELFGYYWCEKGIKFATDYQANIQIVKKWDEYMKDVMVMDVDPITDDQPLLTKVFEFNN